MIILSGLVSVDIPVNMFLYLQVCILFANMDILKGEEIYGEHLTFKDLGPLNDAFDFFGVGDQNMINNSGSYFLIQIGLLAFMVFKCFVNQLAIRMSKFFYARKVGIWAYEDAYFSNLSGNSVKLFMESYFDLMFCNSLGIRTLVSCKNYDEFASFFGTPLEVMSSSITILYFLLLTMYPIYGFVMIHKNQGKLDTQKVQN